MPDEEKTKAQQRAERKKARQDAKKASRMAKVVVTVMVEGQVAMKGQAVIPGYEGGSVTDETVQGAIRSAALRCIATAPLQDAKVVRGKLHEVHVDNVG